MAPPPDRSRKQAVPTLPSPRPQPPRRGLILSLVLLLGLHPVAGYLYLPALPQLQHELNIPAATAQLTLSALVLSFGLGQVLWGPLADRHGRRPVLLAGLGMLLAASLAVAASADIVTLLIGRCVQGLGVAAAGVCARAMLRDLYQPIEGVRLLSIGFSWVGVIALAGPPLGAALAGAGGFRAPLLLMAGCAALALLDVVLRVPETRAPPEKAAARRSTLLRDWRLLLRDRTFVAYTALTAASYTGHYLFLAMSPFALIGERGLTALEYGYALSASSAVHLGANYVCRRWLARAGIRATLRKAGGVTLAGGLGLALLQWADVHAAWAIIVPQWLYMFGHAMHQSCGQAAVSAPFPQCAGTAASLSGFVLTLIAVLAGELLKLNMTVGAAALAYGMAICAVATATVAWGWVQRDGEIDFTGRSAA